MGENESVAHVRRWFELGEGGVIREIPARRVYEEFFAEDVEYVPIANYPGARPCRGIDEYMSFMSDWLTGWGEVAFEGTSYEAHGDSVIVRVVFETRGGESRLPLSGRVFAVYTLRDGKIVRHQDFLNAAEARRAAGLTS
jgi:ketosteroid isomerase-like protein